MTDEKLLHAISDIVETKVQVGLSPLKDDIILLKDDVASLKDRMQSMEGRMTSVEDSVHSLRLHIENETDKNIRILAENYVPSAKGYSKETEKIETIQSDIEIIKKVVKNHSDVLNQIAG